MSKKVLTIQDISCVGQCSITVALPVISAMGVETCVLPSAVLSTHTSGFKGYTFHDLTEDLPLIKEHWIKENIKFDVFYTGYIGSYKQLKYITDIIDTCATKDRLVIIDPVCADNGELYTGFNKDFVKGMASICGKADVILPNLTEAAFLLNEEYIGKEYDKEYIEKLLKKLALLGSKNVLLTGVSLNEGKLGIALYNGENKTTQYYFREKIPKDFHGTGDVYASSFVGALARGCDLYESAKIAVDFTIEAIANTIDDPYHNYGVKFEKALPYLIGRINK